MKSEKKSIAEKRKQGVLMEDLDGKLDQVLEGYAALDAKIDRNHEEFREFATATNERFDIVDEKFDAIEERFKGVDERLRGVDERFNDVDEQFKIIYQKFEIVFDELHGLRTQRVA